MKYNMMCMLVSDFLNKKELLKSRVELFVKNKENSIEDRWDIFCKSRLGIRDNWFTGMESLDKLFGGEFSPYDDLNMERYSVKTAQEITESLEGRFTEKEIETVMEEFMQNFIWEVRNDW